MIELSTYVLETLRKDEEFILYRGRSQADAPGILVVSPVAEYLAPETLKRLEHEYSLKEALDPAWAARPIAIARHRNRPVLLLEDPGGLPLDQFVGPDCDASARTDAAVQPSDVGFFLRLAIGLSSAIGHLHQRGIIHKDIKPANVLLNSVTGQCWLRAFGIASRLPRERQAPEPPEFVAGTLAYMAPEQTGRMNRSIDSRSDLYSLGVTLYEVLTGTLPFTASDPMDWVHCHIARQPMPPGERLKGVPATVSAIIMKLLAKTAEERYQTAAGVQSDLRRCLAEWERGSAGATRLSDPTELVEVSSNSSPARLSSPKSYQIEEFPLGEHDTPDRLLIPEKLYGRAREIETLLASFDRVAASGTPELVFVYGYSGIGKSSVVNELHKVLVPPRGFFASGKFDQYRRNIPYATLGQAFQSLIRPLLGKSEADLRKYRDALLDALGPNGQLMVDLVPELKLIIGEQRPVPELPPRQAQARFQLVFGRFIGVFARPEHPLAVFLDDLQWLDAATLDLLEDLFSRSGVQHLMFIGAYRDNEVNAAHPLMRKLEAIRQAGAILHEIILAPLARADLGQLIADCFHCELGRVTPLAQLVYEKTAGNPFFAIQFISALVEEGLVTFGHGDGRWSWDLNRIQAKGHTDNVVDLMVWKLKRLPLETQKALQRLACVGNRADFATLALILGESEDKIHGALWEATRAGLVLRLDTAYTFLHDRVQEAAYAIIPDDERAAVHLRIGTLFASRTAPEEIEENIFEIVNQLNRGSGLIESSAERERVAELNFIAGNRAKASTAYSSALAYFVAGRGLVGEDSWERLYKLTFALEFQQAECEFLTGDFAAAEELLAKLSHRAANLVDSASVARLQTELYATLDKEHHAVEIGLEYLRRVGIDWSPHPTKDEVRQEYDRVWKHLGPKSIEALIDLPPMIDPDCRATLDVLTALEEPAYFADENLQCLVIARMANLSLQYGNSDGSCVAYVQLGWVVGSRFGDYPAGFRFGKLGLDLMEKRGLERFRAQVSQLFGYFVNLWSRHLRTSLGLLRDSFVTAREAGDLKYAAFFCDRLVTFLLAVGDSLEIVQGEAEHGLEFAQKAKFGYVVDIIIGQLRFIRTLRGLTPSLSSFNDAEFDEGRFEQHLEADPHLEFATCWYWIRKLQARFYARDYASALAAASKAEPLLQTPGHFESAEYIFYDSLARAAQYNSASSEERAQYKEALAAHYRQILVFAQNCPENFENRAALVGAEIARIEGRDFEAMHLYEEAIRSAHANGFVHNEALAYELAAQFYAAHGFEKIAHAYVREARYCYLHWGATGKVQQLDELYPHLRDEGALPGPTGTIGAPIEKLDLATVIKVSQALSGEMVFGKLIDTLMRAAIEHAGAERGLLILPRGVEQRVEAEATTSGDTIFVHLKEAFVTEAAVPMSIVNYVVRTQETVILNDASTQSSFSKDPYIRQHRTRSILCLPLSNQAKLIGLLYLENNLTSHVFTPKRIAVLKLLASQAAISLENARLYRDLQEREAKIRRLVDANIMGIFIWNLEGKIIDANEAFLNLLNYGREDLVSGCVRWTELTAPEWRDQDDLVRTELMERGSIQPFQKEFFRKDGSRVPVMIGSALFESGKEGVAFVLDLSEQKRAEERLQKAQAELAHVSRMTTLGELTASIAHEINQPLTAIVTNANAGLRWLAGETPDLEETRQSIRRIIRDGKLASGVVSSMRALFKKAPEAKQPLDINDVIQEVLTLTQSEVQRHRVSIQTLFATDLPLIIGDRIQLQQVILNLLLNAIQAMSELIEGPRELCISSQKIIGSPGQTDSPGLESRGSIEVCGIYVLVAVRDTGPGLGSIDCNRLFKSFYTTKPEGLGMGLAISHSIIEAHGGRLWAEPNEDRGATFQFTLPGALH